VTYFVHGCFQLACCSYEARAKGVKNGMYLGRAISLCPDLVTIPYDFEAHTEVSCALYNTNVEYTLAVEAVSCQEMFFDCSSALRAVMTFSQKQSRMCPRILGALVLLGAGLGAIIGY